MKLKFGLVSFPFILAVTLAGAQTQADDIPSVRIPRVDTPPVVDGRLAEPVWRKAARVNLRDNQTGDTAVVPTEAWLIQTDGFLHVAFLVTDTDVSATLTARDDNLWREEVVEIFLDPEGLGREYLEIEVNPLGALFDAWINFDTEIDFESAVLFDLNKLSVGVHVHGTLNDTSPDTGWTCELSIPLTELPTPLSTLPRLNLTRIDRENARHVYRAWSPTLRWFHVPSRFGHGRAKGDGG
ncbi:carbohydrate-binding family 9-like protein [bacterium]|nr:carbohydrate-binding family 9-like protein [bacterium]